MLSSLIKENSKNVIWTMIGNGSYALSQFVAILFIGKVLGAKDVGVYSFAIALTTPLLIFLNLGLRMQLMTDIKLEIPINIYKIIQLINSCIGMVLLLLMCLFFNFSQEIFAAIILIGLMKSVEYQSELYYGYLQRQNLNKVVSKSLFFKSIVFIIVLIVSILYSGKLLISVTCAVVAYSLFCIIYDNRNILSKVAIYNKEFKKEYFFQVVRIGLPLSLSTLLISMNVNAPRLILGKFDIQELGYFASVVAFMQIGTLLVVSLGQVFSGKMAVAYHAENYKEYFKMAYLSIALAGLIGVFGLILSYFLGEFILRNIIDYNRTDNIMFYIFLVAPFQYMMTMFGYVHGATRNSKTLFLINLPVFVTVLISSFLFIPENGIFGVIFSMLSGFILGCLFYTYKLLTNFKRLVKS